MEPKNCIVIDFETYYDDAYTLSNMPTAQYILDPQFEIIGCAYKLNDAPIHWVPGGSTLKELRYTLGQLPWDTSVAVAHNAMFDGAILEWILDIHPAKYFCTWQAAGPAIGPFVKSTSLANCAKFLNLGEKGTEVYNAKGKHISDFTAEEFAAYAEYCKNDVRLTHKLYRVLKHWYYARNVNVS